MDQRGGLERLTGRFPGESGRREFTKFVIDQWQQFLGGSGITLLHPIENARSLGH